MTKGVPGTAHFDFRVAQRGGEPCPDCGDTIERVPVQNRGICFCPRCQRFGLARLMQKSAVAGLE